MTDILTGIDRAIDGLCPCGAPPRPGSAYCGPDCEPTHYGPHTGHSAMRWRPDLVTAAAGTGLTSLGGRVRSGRFWREMFQHDGTDSMHLRVDDGHRFVGADLAADADHDQANALWLRLERELTNPANTAPEGGTGHPRVDPVERPREIYQRVAAQARPGIPNWERRCRACGRHGEPMDARRFADPRPNFRRFWTAAGVVDSLVEVEVCQVCPHCREPYPGPVLHMSIGIVDRRSGREWHYRLTAYVGDRKYGQVIVVSESELEAAYDPAERLRRKWDRMEEQLLRAIMPPPPPSPARLRVTPPGTAPDDRFAWREVGYTPRDGLTPDPGHATGYYTTTERP
ncbi:hypothetical protein ABZ671_00690 [Micromonospora sp. NPDC006766]|uniref:hypothetical protein n=1 Tax=Micromonospora sp. NPDC006766 TaxID=3154778 RepID=UPI0033DA8AB3